jgi:hypothetical protein
MRVAEPPAILLLSCSHPLLPAVSKAVYQVEYLLPTTDCDWCVWSYDAWNKTVCPNATTYGLTPILKQLDLEQAPYYTCK